MMIAEDIEGIGACTHIGAFDSEKFWREDTLAKLPAMNDANANNIVLAMDELQFVFCKQGDSLVTRYGMDPAHKTYLEKIGYSFLSNQKDVSDRYGMDKTQKNKSVFQLLIETENKEYFKKIIAEDSTLSAFAVIPFSEEVSDAYRMRVDVPAMDTIRKVNSKVYSTTLKEKIGIPNISRIVTSCKELQAVADEYLGRYAIIIKDEYGVSGKGNLLVHSPAILQRIISYLASQEKRGKQLRFIIEPYLEKKLDFSCQFFISISGRFHLLSLQKILNSGFAYHGSFSIDEELMRELEDSHYFNWMEKTAECLYEDGYYGHVCIDSMVLKDGEIVPIIEINARKSMSLLKHYLDKYLHTFALKGNFTYISAAFQGRIVFEELLEQMEKEGLLFQSDRKRGIIPLTANTLFINRDTDHAYDAQKTYKGRLYFAAVGEHTQTILEDTQTMKAFMENRSFKIQY